MGKMLQLFNTVMNFLMAVSLAIMAILVFGNVVLRYAFDSGIPWSEEMSRFLFVWMVFLGAIGVLKDNNHLGVDLFINKLPSGLRKGVFVISQIICLYILWLVLEGSWKLTMSSLESFAPATGLSYAYLYGIGIILTVGMGLIIFYQIYQVFVRKVSIEELSPNNEIHEEFTESHLDQQPTAAGGER